MFAVDDELVKVVRSQRPADGTSEEEFNVEVISPVRFAPLIPNPSIKTIIPARIWSPSEHHFYPESFRNACKEILLCSNAKRNQPLLPQPPQKNVNAASMIPQDLWMKVLSFTHRDWFETPQNEVEFLRKRLAEEKANAERANAAKLEAERRCEMAEKERDVYRLLARRWQSRMQASSGNADNDNETVEEAAAAILMSGREHNMMFGLGNMLRRFRARASASARQEEDSSEGEEEDSDDASDRMEEDNDEDDDHEMNEDSDNGEEDSSSEEDDESLSMSSNHPDAMDGRIAKSLRSQATARTVSLSEDDF